MTFHRISFGRCSEVVIFEPTKGIFYWLSMYIEPYRRGRGDAERAFLCSVNQLHGWHLIHCSMEIASFSMLAKKYRWRRVGVSGLVVSCDEFLFVSAGQAPRPDKSFRSNYQRLERAPKLRYFRSQSDVRGIISDIKKICEIR